MKHLSAVAEEKFAHFFDQSSELMCVLSMDGSLKHLNPAWTTQLGRTQEELLAKPVFDIVHPDDREATRTKLDTLALCAKTINFENRCHHQNGSWRWLRWRVRRVPRRAWICAIAQDVTRQKQLEREVLEILDQERARLARDLHDGLGQTLAGISALSAKLSRRLGASNNLTASAEAIEIAQLLNEAITETRDLARGINTVDLDEGGLDWALKALALETEDRFPVSCTFASDCPFVGAEVGAHVYRIVLQAVNNALKHGQGDRIEITLRAKDGKGLLSVRDNGKGLREVGGISRGIGLRTMDYRARLIGGSLKVQRRASCGIVVTCAFPLPATLETREAPDHAIRNA